MPDGPKRPVVVIEDDSSMSQALERILRLGGHEPRKYVSAEAYLESGDASVVACFVIDVQLPGISGFDLQARLAQTNGATPIIFVTAFDTPEARARAHEAGAAGFLVKPFSGRLLLETVATAVAEA